MSATGKCPSRHEGLRAPAQDSGFTLLEMMVAVAILALITGIAYPRLQVLIARQTLAQACGVVALAVAKARGEAVGRDLPTQVILAEQGDALLISRNAAIPLPAGAIIEWPRRGVMMFGDGSSSGASGIVRAGATTRRFVIDPATARLQFGS
jgi:prepilin-type N-terminal cleavage/methylation domain-containing protein